MKEKVYINIEDNDNTHFISSNYYNRYRCDLKKAIRFDTDLLLKKSYEDMEYVGETIEKISKDLIKDFKLDIKIQNFYAFLMREILRNCIEHSEAKEFILKIYINPTEKYFAFKVSDSGIGLRKSINTNPRYNVVDDKSALAFSIRPGITRSWKKDPLRDDEWQNSGFGLFMVSEIINKIGYFEIRSGDMLLYCKCNDSNKYYEKCKIIKGTEVTVVIDQKINIDIAKTIKDTAKKGNEIAANNKVNDFSKYATYKTASKASTLINE